MKRDWLWWLIKRTRVGRWFFVRTVTEFLYDLELAESGVGDGLKEKWLARLDYLRRKP